MKTLLFGSMLAFTSTCSASSGLEIAHGFSPAKSSALDIGQTWRLSYSHGVHSLDSLLNQYNLNLRLELSLQRWSDDTHKTNHVISLNPMFQYQWQLEPLSIYLEIGIGAAYIHNTAYLDRDLGTNWLFEDRVGLGVIFNQHHRVGLSFIHYSNADLASINDGADSIGLSYGYFW